jgi:hypothetical protein
MKKTLLILLSIICFTCSSDDDNNSCDNLPSNGEEITVNYITKGLEYFTDPSSERCVAYNVAAEAYIEYSNGILGCLDADDRTELEEEIQDLETELAELDCA